MNCRLAARGGRPAIEGVPLFCVCAKRIPYSTETGAASEISGGAGILVWFYFGEVRLRPNFARGGLSELDAGTARRKF